jgi:hypothetical protein
MCCITNHNGLCQNKASLECIHLFMVFVFIAGILNTIAVKLNPYRSRGYNED